MPLIKDSSKSSKSVAKESQRVRTEKPAEEKRSKKHDESLTKSRLNSDEKSSRRPEQYLSDSKKVANIEESKIETRKSSKSKTSEEKPKKSRAELQIPDDYDEYAVKKSLKTSSSKKHSATIVEPDGDTSSSKSKAKSPSTPIDAHDYEYEEDFEQEYADDFDDENDLEDHPKPQPIMQKSSPQPEAVSKRSSSDSSKRVSDDTYESDHRPLRKPTQPEPPKTSVGLNFKAAIQKTSRLSRRANDLLRLVTFDVTRIDFFDFPVVSEYDLYIMSYGKANRKQTATQTFDDAISRDTQTEKLEIATKWTQNPPRDEEEHSGVESGVQNNSKKGEGFNEFIKDAGATILRVLDDVANRQGNIGRRTVPGGRKRVSTKFGAVFGTKMSSFVQSTFLPDESTYQLERIIFPPHSSSFIVSVHGPKGGEVSFAQPHKIAIWSVSEDDQHAKRDPKIIISAGVKVTCVAMESALTPELLFVGHSDGSLAVWDFRTSLQNSASFRSSGVVATNQTVFTTTDTHLAPLKCLLPLALSSSSSLTESQAGLRCELLSLDESGLLATWAVADLGSTGHRVINEDPAVTPGGRIRLLRSSFGNIGSSNPSHSDGLLEPTCLIEHPTSSSRVLIGMSSGDTLHVARYGGRGGGLGSGHPSVFTKKFSSPILTLAHLNTEKAALLENMVATSENIGAFIASTALGFSIYITSRSAPVLNFETDPIRLISVFPIPTSCTTQVLGDSSPSEVLATVAALTGESKVQLYQIGPKCTNHWSGPASEIPAVTSSARATGGNASSVISMQFCVDTSAVDSDEVEPDNARRFATAVSYSTDSIEIFLTEPVAATSTKPGSGPAKTESLIDFLSNLV